MAASLDAIWPHLSLVAWLLWAGYVLVLAGWIVLQKREPIATLSWVLSLALLPFVGLLVYYLIGPQRIARQRLRRQRARAGLQASLPPPPDLDADCATVMHLARRAGDLPTGYAENVELLVDGARTYAAMLAAIAGARQHVHLECYIFEPDQTGTAIRDALAERARAGVPVRLLLDAVGSASLGAAFLAPLREAGADVAWFHPMRWLRLGRLKRPRVNLRNHRKLMVVDGRIAFTGGINITDSENESLSPTAYRDLHLRLEGEAVRWLQLAFVEDWHYASKQALHDESLWPVLPHGPVLAQVLVSGPDTTWEAIHRVMVEAIHQANHRVWLVTPYFVPGEAARMALTSAALRGLDVRVMVPARSDSRVVSAAARSYYDELLAAGVRVFEYGPRMLHSKALLIDEETTLVGSANFDQRSFRLNFELSLLLQDARLAEVLAATLTEDFGHCREIPCKRPPAPWLARLGEGCARLLSPVL